MYDHSMRVPFIVVGPDVPAGERRDTPIYMQDVMPTALELADAEKPSHVEFQSLLPLIKDEPSAAKRSALYGCYLKDLQRMVRVGDWKLLVYPEAHVLKLFNLKNDPHEMHDLSTDAKYADKVDELFERLVQLQKDMDDPMDLKVVFPRGEKTLSQ